jgi:hypothetical protein
MTFVIVRQPGEDDLDETPDRGLGPRLTGGGEGVQAVPGGFPGRHVGTDRASSPPTWCASAGATN